ncbi:MAG: dihydrolipoyllysine-residue acetyltransferase [Pseudomonadota bacterium]
MAEEIKIPDIGTTDTVDVIEVFVKPGDQINKDDSLITLESDKASMEVPAAKAGTVKALQVKVGDKVKEGQVILTLETTAGSAETAIAAESKKIANEATNKAQAQAQENIASASPAQNQSPAIVEETINIPDIGTTAEVDVIEVFAKVGDELTKDDPMITLEGEKASMELPAPKAGKVSEVMMQVGDKVTEGMAILKLAVAAENKIVTEAPNAEAETPTEISQPSVPTEKTEISEAKPSVTATQPPAQLSSDFSDIYAGPAVRRLARELGVDLHKVAGSGRKQRITLEDVQQFVKKALTQPVAQTSAGIAVAKAPQIDFTKFGETEMLALSKIKRLTGQNTHRSWVTVPHVTQFDEADITDMEAFRQQQKQEAAKLGFKLTPLVFLLKAIVACLKEFPSFNASLDASGENLILKKYFNIGVAVDTPNGLVVPVIRQVDQKGIFELAKELAEISAKAREKGLSLTEMQGGCFTISSLGGIGGTAFTPIVNNPEVAILGVSRSQQKPVFINGEFKPRLMLPLSLSYDHRVIDGAQAARFTSYLSYILTDIRRLLF